MIDIQMPYILVLMITCIPRVHVYSIFFGMAHVWQNILLPIIYLNLRFPIHSELQSVFIVILFLLGGNYKINPNSTVICITSFLAYSEVRCQSKYFQQSLCHTVDYILIWRKQASTATKHSHLQHQPRCLVRFH